MIQKLKLFVTISTIVFIISGCGKEDDHTGENCIDNNPEFVPEAISESGTHSLKIYTDSRIVYPNEYQYEITIDDGDKTVFYYSYYEDPEEFLADDDFMEVVVFETESDISEFLISGADLKTASALYGSLCFCYPAGYFDITSGCIKGVKLSNTEWQIDINIEAEKSGHLFTKMLSETFSYNEN